MRVAQYLTDRSSAHNQPDGGPEFSQASDFTADHSFSVDEPEPLESWSLRARVHAFRELFGQGSHGVAGCFATDTLVCASLQGSTPDKLLAMHDWLLGLFNKNYLIIDVTTADEGLMNVAGVLQWHVQKLPIALSEPPSFTAMWEFCDLVNNHMQRHPRSGVLLVSANSRNRAGLLVGAYLLSQGACPTAIDALSLWSVLRSENHMKSRTISKGVSNKTYQLYLSYFGHFFSSGKDARAAPMPNNALFAVGRVLISHMFINPTTSSDSSSPPTYELHVFMNGLPFRVAAADYDAQQSRVRFHRVILECVLFFAHTVSHFRAPWLLTSLLLAMLILDRYGLNCVEAAANKAFFRLFFTQVSSLLVCRLLTLFASPFSQALWWRTTSFSSLQTWTVAKVPLRKDLHSALVFLLI